MLVPRRRTPDRSVDRGPGGAGPTAGGVGVACTVAAQVGALGSSLLTFKLAAVAFGVEGFGAYAVARRVAAVVGYPLLMGLGVSLPRFVSTTREDDRADRYLGAALILAGLTLATAAVALLAVPEALGAFFFGDRDGRGLLWPTFAVVAGSALTQLIYGDRVGRLRMKAASALWLVNIAAMPPAAVALSGGDVARSLTVLGLGTLAVASTIGLGILRRLRPGSPRSWLGPFRRLVAFGLPRMPGEFALFGLAAVPTVVIAHRAGFEEAGRFSFAFSLVQLVGGLFAAGSAVLLPIVGRMKARGEVERIGPLIARVLAAALLAAAAVVAVLEASLGLLLPALLDDRFAGTIAGVRWSLLGAVPYAAYIVLRGPLDALETWPHNAINLCVALGAIAALLRWGPPAMPTAAALLVGLAVLGAGSALCWSRCLGRLRGLGPSQEAPEP